MKPYDHKSIEAKWQKKWEKSKAHQAADVSSRPHFYALIEFPFPSGDGMHAGHLRSNTAMDIIARKRRAEGFNVLYPIGWDAFGLPTENYAIKTGLHPKVVTKQNTDNFRRQLKSAGFSFDWSREINTSDPAYYRWTQWIFLEMYKKGLAYKKRMLINWCPKDKIGLANEEVVDGKCERCGTTVEKREKEQWMLAITKYADRLHDDLDTVNYLEKIKIQQRNWIGKSKGAEIEFKIKGGEEKITVFTTRADTLFGVTYVVLAPEHEMVEKLESHTSNFSEVSKYCTDVKKKSELDRTAEGKEKTGVKLEGIVAINPANHEEIPVYVADYVLGHYGTGAVMAVPAHDERDLAFAQKYALPIKQIDLADAEEITKKYGKSVTTYKLRDWVFSRQRYWGEPIPMIQCGTCGWVPVPEKDLPVTLPEVKNYQPSDNGESPLAAMTDWVKVKCPNCKAVARRETDTMPNWAGSSWYFLRYADPENKKSLAAPEKLEAWMPVDWYNGGMEHTTLHLLYSRFWNKFLYDIGVVPVGEPYTKRTSHGLILAEGGEKMSKSKGNVVNPDGIISSFGADTLRLYEMFMGPFDQAVTWSMDGIVGPRRFLERVWKMSEKVPVPKLWKRAESDPIMPPQMETVLHKTIKKVSEDIELMQFNTAVSALMIAANELDMHPAISRGIFGTFLKLLSPFAPHITEELWAMIGNKNSIHQAPWPQFDMSKIQDEAKMIAVQVNGKVRGEFTITADSSEEEIKKRAQELPEVSKWLAGKEVKKVIYVKGKLVSIVVNSENLTFPQGNDKK